MVTQPGSRSAATTLPRSSGSATPTESSPAGGCPQLTAQQCTQTPQSGVERPDPPICVHYRGHAGLPATQQCTQTPQTGAERPDPPICVHYCGHGATCDTTVYTNAPIWRPEALATHLCTLLRLRGRPRHDSVHKRPKLARRGPCHPFVYTITAPRAAHGSIVYTNAPKIQQKSHREFGTSPHLSCLSKNAAILSNGMASFPPPS